MIMLIIEKPHWHLFLQNSWLPDKMVLLLLLFFVERIIRKILRANNTGNSLIAIVMKNNTGLIIITVAIHIKSIQIDVDPFSARIFQRTSIARFVVVVLSFLYRLM